MREFIIDERYAIQYQANNPNYIVLDDFISHEKVARIEEAFNEIKPNDKWYAYDTPFEKKLATDKIEIMPWVIRDMLFELNSQEFVQYLETLTGIDGLIPDPWLRGGGIHIIPQGGFLDIHSDRSYHPKLGLYRRVNVLIYLNRSYMPNYGGRFELWDKDMKECITKIDPIFNRCVIFNTDAESMHGHPDPWKSNRPRMSLATYYFTKDIPENFKANLESTDFRKRPSDPDDTKKDELRIQRKKLRLNG